MNVTGWKAQIARLLGLERPAGSAQEQAELVFCRELAHVLNELAGALERASQEQSVTSRRLGDHLDWSSPAALGHADACLLDMRGALETASRAAGRLEALAGRAPTPGAARRVARARQALDGLEDLSATASAVARFCDALARADRDGLAEAAPLTRAICLREDDFGRRAIRAAARLQRMRRSAERRALLLQDGLTPTRS